MAHGIRITTLVDNVDTGEAQVELGFPKVDGTEGNLRLARSTLIDTRRLQKELLDKGAKLTGLNLSDLIDRPAERRLSVSGTTGWRGNTAFVLPNVTIGQPQVVFDPGALAMSPSPVGSCGGSVEAWTKALRPALRRSSFLTMFTGLAFAAPLAALIGVEETAVFHAHGESGVGKTLLAKLIASVAGRALEKDLMSFNATSAAMDDVLARGNGMLVPLNEMKLADTVSGAEQKNLSAFGHVVTSGVGRVRSAHARQSPDLAQRRWTAFALTNGEKSLGARFGGGRDAGEQARFIDVPIPRRKKGGIFDRYAPYQDAEEGAAALARKVEDAIAFNYGAAFVAFIEHVIGDPEAAAKRFATNVDEFVSRVAPADSWERRFARKFAYAYAGGMEALLAKTMPARGPLIRRSCVKLYKLARNQLVSDQEQADRALSRLAEIDGSNARFPIVERGVRAPDNFNSTCWGMQRTMPGIGACIGIRSQRLLQWAGTRAALSVLMDRLKAGGAHVPGTDKARLTKIVEILGVKKRRYVVLRVAAVRALATETKG